MSFEEEVAGAQKDKINPMESIEKFSRARYQWRLRSRSLELGRRTLIMGVLNVTPDSFADEGRYRSKDCAIDDALKMVDAGVDIVDVGGESTRPGRRAAVTAEEEAARVIPVIDGILQARPDAVVSVDTYKSDVARIAVSAGAEIVNDVSAFRWDSAMAETVAQLKCGAVIAHSRGRPDQWRHLEPISDVTALVSIELAEWAATAIDAGVPKEGIVLDPGFGFGKNFDENYSLLMNFDHLDLLGFPLLAGTSRKSFIGRTLATNGKDAPPAERLYGTLATVTVAILKGAHMVRVHDTGPAMDAAKVADATLNSE